MARKHAVGIDLGTTYTAAAWMGAGGDTRMLLNDNSDILTPSVVLFEEGEILVGKDARKAGALKPSGFAEAVKRDMGKPVYSRPIHHLFLPPEVIQACILRQIREDIVRQIGPEFGVVITVPAFFDEPRRRATAVAGEIAGLHVLDIVNEPTAAALNFGESLGLFHSQAIQQTPQTVLVYDLGGGTFDVTLLEIGADGFRALATDGDVHLGGRDWDRKLADVVAEQYIKRLREDPRENPVTRMRLMAEVERAKHTLSARRRAEIRMDFAGSSEEITITREQFEDATIDLLERTSHTTREVLITARVKWTDVSHVLLSGGATRMPMVSKMLEKLSGKTPSEVLNPDEAVARGAAIYAKYLLDQSGEGAAPKVRITNVNSHNLGLAGVEEGTDESINAIIIPRNTELPARATKPFVTKRADQRSIVIRVLEGESASPSDCTVIAKTFITNLPPNLPKGHPVYVTYEYETNGRLRVHAEAVGAGRDVRLEVVRENALADSMIGLWKNALRSGLGFAAFREVIAEQERLKKATPHGVSTPAGAASWSAKTSTPDPTADKGDVARWRYGEQPADDEEDDYVIPLGDYAPAPTENSAPPADDLHDAPITSQEPTQDLAAQRAPRPSRRQPSVRRFRPIIEIAKMLMGGAAGLTISQLFLWWALHVDPLGVAPRLPPPLRFLAPADVRSPFPDAQPNAEIQIERRN